MKKKIMIYAYTNFNLGDDLFIKILCERYPETQFILYAPTEYRYNFGTYGNISIVASNKFSIRLLNYMMKKLKGDFSIRSFIAKRCDAIVQIGGSVFIEKDNWVSIPNYQQKIGKKPYYVLGANFGPFSKQRFYKDHYDLFKKFTDICFRDTYSYKLFEELPNVRQSDDIVFQMDYQQISTNDKNVVISVIKPSFRKNLKGYDGVYYEKIKDVTINLVRKGYSVTLMSFCQREGDQRAVEEIVQKLPEEFMVNVNTYYYKYDIEEALDIIKSSMSIVATRFHAMILGWVFNKPVFPISYSEKMNNVMKDINYQGSYINLKDIKNLNPALVESTIETNLVDVSKQAKNAEKHFKKLDEFLL